MDGAIVRTSIIPAAVGRFNSRPPHMPDEKSRVSKNCRVFLDGERASEGSLTITVGPTDGMLCTLDGKVVSILSVVYNEDSGEIDEIYLEEVWE